MKKCLNCGQEILEGSKPRIIKYCVTCAPIVAREYIRNYQKTKDEAKRIKRLAKFEQLYNEAMKLPPTTLAYIAGLFDGEGSVCIIKTKPAKRHSAPMYSLRVDISNQDTNALYFVKNTFNVGGVNQSRGYDYKWNTANRSAAIFLKVLLPYLIIKKDKAILGIGFQETINKEYHGYLNRLSQSQIDEREKLRQRMLTLNHFYRAKYDNAN